MIPFELYSISPDIPEFGEIYRIPNYYTPSELSTIQSSYDSDRVMTDRDYPSHRVEHGVISEKSKWLFDNWSEVCELTRIDGVEYYKNDPSYVDESIRGSMGNSRLYPPHTDCGSRKLLTILVPLCEVGCPTMFNGVSRSRVWCHEWALNDAYMFRPSNRSYHSYQNTMDCNRWIGNINICGVVPEGGVCN